LKKFDHKIKKTNVQVKDRYALSSPIEIASLTIKLPDFCNNKTIDIQAYIKDKTVGRHGIIKGIRFIQQLGLIFDFQHNTVTWDEITLPMHPLGTIKMNEFVPIEPPTILQKAINKKMLPMLVMNMIIVLWCSLAHTSTPTSRIKF
jgi:hypothetical protein